MIYEVFLDYKISNLLDSLPLHPLGLLGTQGLALKTFPYNGGKSRGHLLPVFLIFCRNLGHGLFAKPRELLVIAYSFLSYEPTYIVPSEPIAGEENTSPPVRNSHFCVPSGGAEEVNLILCKKVVFGAWGEKHQKLGKFDRIQTRGVYFYVEKTYD